MRIFVIIILSLVWCGFSSDFSWPNAILGLLVATGTYYLVPIPEIEKVHFRPLRFIILLIYIGWQLLISSLQVAWAIMQPKSKIQPALIAVPIECKTSLEIMLLSNIVSLTPGSLTIDISSDKKYLFIHTLFGKDPEQVKRNIKQQFERKVIKVFAK